MKYPASAHFLAISASPEKLWNTTTVRRALLGQHPQHVVVRLAVVDHQRLAGALGDLDVRAEARVLVVRRAQSR